MITDCPLMIVIYHISHIILPIMNATSILYAFLGGAIVGAGAALLLAPEKGEDTRKRIREILRKKGIICCDSEIDALVEQLTSEVEAE